MQQENRKHIFMVYVGWKQQEELFSEESKKKIDAICRNYCWSLMDWDGLRKEKKWLLTVSNDSKQQLPLQKFVLYYCSRNTLLTITTPHHACVDNIHELNNWPFKKNPWLPESWGFCLTMPVLLVLDEMRKNTVVHVKVTFAWMFAYLHLSAGIYQGCKPKWSKKSI